MWQARDKESYSARLGAADLAAMRIELDEVLPEDVAERVTTLTTARTGGALDRETYSAEVLQTMGIAGDAGEIAAAAAAEESTALGIIPGSADGTE